MLDSLHINLRRAREKAGFSQTEMAEELGVGRTTYINFETGRTRLYNPMLDKMAGKFGMDVETLIFGERPENLEDPGVIAEMRSSLIAEYEEQLAKKEESLAAAQKVIDAQETTIRTLSDSNAFLMSQLRKEQ